MYTVRAMVALLSLAISGLASAADTSNYSAAVEYIRCLATTYNLQREATAELAQSKDPTSKLMTGVRMSTKANLEMRAMIYSLDQLDVGDDAKPFVGFLKEFLHQKIELNRELIELTSKILDGPQPGVDYGKLMASSAQITATLEQIDKQIFKLANAFFAVMIDKRPDKYGHVSHLKITRAERAQLLKMLKSDFGASLDAKNQNWTVSGAWLMRSNLRKDFKASDDPW